MRIYLYQLFSTIYLHTLLPFAPLHSYDYSVQSQVSMPINRFDSVSLEFCFSQSKCCFIFAGAIGVR